MVSFSLPLLLPLLPFSSLSLKYLNLPLASYATQDILKDRTAILQLFLWANYVRGLPNTHVSSTKSYLFLPIWAPWPSTAMLNMVEDPE